jgi:hypothetical protein
MKYKYNVMGIKRELVGIKRKLVRFGVDCDQRG